LSTWTTSCASLATPDTLARAKRGNIELPLSVAFRLPLSSAPCSQPFRL
jgi:hypothetical protein